MKNYNELDMEFVTLNSADVLTASVTGTVNPAGHECHGNPKPETGHTGMGGGPNKG